MPPSNKWTADAERDLAMAIILSHGAIKHDWTAVYEKMSAWGYEFTTGSMSQHWTKKILKDFKARHSEEALTEPKTPNKATKTIKPASANPSTGKRKHKTEAASDDNTPSKKRAVKKEPKEDRHRERSATVKGDGFQDLEDGDSEF